MVERPSRITQRLSQAGAGAFSTYCIIAAFGAYFCMYAFRKPFTAGTYADQILLGVGYKTVLVATQVTGYTLSKWIGVRVVSEMPPSRRAGTILGLIAFAEAALLGFALVPAPYNFGFLFLNGLPLGMVFGLVLGFLEGRRLSEALVAGLCASFIVSSGVVKSVGRWLIDVHRVSEYWMPFLTGLLFVIPLVLAVAMLRYIPPPSPSDEALRSVRRPMGREERRSFLRRHAMGLSILVTVYVLLTVMRSLRDDFAVEIWEELGVSGQPAIFAKSETLIMLGVVLVNGVAIRIRSNRAAFLGSLWLLAGGFTVVILAVLGWYSGRLGPFAFMVAIGFGTYVPYVAFHTTVFERFLAVFREPGTVGFLMYLADATGYLATVGILFAKSWMTESPRDARFLPLFTTVSLGVAVVSIAITAWLVLHYRGRLPRAGQVEPSPRAPGALSVANRDLDP